MEILVLNSIVNISNLLQIYRKYIEPKFKKFVTIVINYYYPVQIIKKADSIAGSADSAVAGLAG